MPPIELTTAFDPGDYDAGNTYPRTKIVDIVINVKTSIVTIGIDFGDEVAGVWVAGVASKHRRFTIQGEDFSTLMGVATLDGEDIYTAIKRIVYAKLQALDASLAGTVE